MCVFALHNYHLVVGCHIFAVKYERTNEPKAANTPDRSIHFWLMLMRWTINSRLKRDWFYGFFGYYFFCFVLRNSRTTTTRTNDTFEAMMSLKLDGHNLPSPSPSSRSCSIYLTVVTVVCCSCALCEVSPHYLRCCSFSSFSLRRCLLLLCCSALRGLSFNSL